MSISLAKISAAFSSSTLVLPCVFICPSIIWYTSWNKLNQNLSASFPLTVNPNTICLLSTNDAPCKKEPPIWGKKTIAIPHEANSNLSLPQKTSGFSIVICLIASTEFSNFFIFIESVSIFLASIFAFCDQAAKA